MSENNQNENVVTKNAAGQILSVTLKLQFPFKWDGDDDVTELELKRPKGKHLRGLGKDVSMHDLFQIAAKVSGYTPKFFDEMDAVDCIKVTEVIGDFLDSGAKIGKI